MNSRNGVMVAGVVAIMLATVVTGAAAYNSFTADRSASLDVVSDANGVIGLSPGGSDYVSTNADGVLEIDVTGSGANGVNADAILEIGDPANPSSTEAFSFTNNYGQSRSVQLSYALSGSDPAGGSDQVNFTIYDSGGNQVGSVVEGGSATVTLASGSTNYVVLTVNTTQVTDSADYTGTLTISSS